MNTQTQTRTQKKSRKNSTKMHTIKLMALITSLMAINGPVLAADQFSTRCAVQENKSADNMLEVSAKTRFEARLECSLDSRGSCAGDEVMATLVQPLLSHGNVVAPAGSTLSGELTKVIPAHAGFGANGKIDITFTSINTPQGQSIPILAKVDSKSIAAASGGGENRVANTLGRCAVGGLAGAAVGVAVGSAYGAGYHGYGYYGHHYYGHAGGWGRSVGYGAASGAAAGLAAGLLSAAMSEGQDIHVAKGSPIECVLKTKIEVETPVASNPNGDVNAPKLAASLEK